jgi:glucose-6-phosphate 1-dehydrogenase
MSNPESCLVVIFGASGDLAKRKLVPALFNLYRQKLLPRQFAVLGVSRTDFSEETFREQMGRALREFGGKGAVEEENLHEFIQLLYYQSIETKTPEHYALLKSRLEAVDKERQLSGNFIYYLATPPAMYEVVATSLASQGLHAQSGESGWKRIIVEKPFGTDLDSAIHLNRQLQNHFLEDHIYRIDHYLGKETVQNTLAFRFANGIFEPLWNRNYVHRVEVTAVEHLGVENRGGYYDHAGALRDMVQNHLLQIAGLIAMESPPLYHADAVRDETLKVFQSLRPIRREEVAQQVVRGQYVSSTLKGKLVPGYREEKDVAPDSRTETFVALKFFIDNWRWGGVPFFIRTGKRMPTRVTEIVIHFKKTPHRIFRSQYASYSAGNQLIIRIQPDEGILLKFGMKRPGAGFDIREVNMDFHYSDLSEVHLPDAYERLLLDCMLGDATLYARADAVEACWNFVTPILQAWKENPDLKIHGYPAGTWGPREARQLFDDPEEDWRYPCKNLVNDGLYCEL